MLGIDIGGTGSRAALEPLSGGFGEGRVRLDGPQVSISGGGSSALSVAVELIRRARAEVDRAAPTSIAAVAIGATGLASLVANPSASIAALSDAAGGAPVAVAIDAVTAHLGALGGAPGAVVAVGTGAIALGTDLHGVWRRVGGWGHLYDDRGSAAWIGIEGLKAAIMAHDGLDRDAAALLSAAESRFGPAPTWPGQLYTRDDRGAVLAGFAADVSGLAELGDAASVRIMSSAGALVAGTLAAALDSALPRRAAGVGGVFASGKTFNDAFHAEFARLAPDATLVAPAGSPLDGAVRLARLVAIGGVPGGHPPFVWR
ncbi:hypothetical protein MUN74_12405 [Agromyces endophyticus]|uniref:N-acetylglucosamine kinase n=1 Tax=Agromyces sp. H17E-10 TaxID=2932244 RepID=UPI001FD3603E|nr:BadF/BadG/BcrA/BcrD ATPase family protein [Agromyces sp. H17E-10]UOQ88091.1 hypothetical protein MUN74_12405 [Agromyces sp. H17E-10]